MTTPAASSADPVQRAQQCLAGLRADRTLLDRIDNYVRGIHPGPYTPRNASQEYRLLAARSVSNFLPMVVAAPAQSLSVEGYQQKGGDGNSPAWEAWQDNRLDDRQAAVYRAAITYGHAFTVVLPSKTDPARPVIRALSPRNMWAAYADPACDEWPMYALELPKIPKSDSVVHGLFYDDKFVYDAVADQDSVLLGEGRPHGLGVCPVRRFAAQVDLEGRTTGVVAPLIPLQDRLNQSVFDLLIVQTYGSFKVRTIAGMTPPLRRDPETGEPLLDAEGNTIPKPVTADASRLLIAPDKDTKFGTLDETPLSGYIESIGMSLRHLAVVSQVPPHYLLGDMVNLSAEALAAAETTLMRMVAEFKRSFGESWESDLRLCAKIRGDENASADMTSQVRWADTESRSLSQTVDALGKAATMLGVPKQALWPKLPGFTDTDRERWPQLAADADSQRALAESLTRAVTGG
ncbi:phage portal protein [Streptomyces fructofermentans]|uniref:Chromosome partitioning protein ParA n=1 Tax=Streptomyces fructofermentans TaxID=152141 RepID=A0A918U685_9ACTN|nr:phage portal protein [Streptomyces fructofermentans]GGX98512.1 chromosome partitioning protein ParA [Streptomyces fructofermentans]